MKLSIDKIHKVQNSEKMYLLEKLLRCLFIGGSDKIY